MLLQLPNFTPFKYRTGIDFFFTKYIAPIIILSHSDIVMQASGAVCTNQRFGQTPEVSLG